MSASVFANVEEGAKIEVFALTASYNADSFKDKVNLSVGGECGSFSINLFSLPVVSGIFVLSLFHYASKWINQFRSRELCNHVHYRLTSIKGQIEVTKIVISYIFPQNYLYEWQEVIFSIHSHVVTISLQTMFYFAG